MLDHVSVPVGGSEAGNVEVRRHGEPPLHTLNGSGVAVGRALVAIPENRPAAGRVGGSSRRRYARTWAGSRRSSRRGDVRLAETFEP